MVYAILIFVQLVISILLVIAILMQAAKGGGLAGIGGGLTSSAMFGGRSAATFLSRATTILAVLFMLNCLTLSVLSKARTAPRSVTQTEEVQPISPVPSTGQEAATGQGTAPSQTSGQPSGQPIEVIPVPAGSPPPGAGGAAPSTQSGQQPTSPK
jgi:preprotein translocase subunit SecG